VFVDHATKDQFLKRYFSSVHRVNSILTDIDCTGVSFQTSGTLVSIIVLLCVVLHPQSVASVITIARIVIAASELVDSSFIVRSFSKIKTIALPNQAEFESAHWTGICQTTRQDNFEL
tara:strand:- start:811 stop:1164 length:354 start_codon:yes stop_codon:yes gene_type:complete